MLLHRCPGWAPLSFFLVSHHSFTPSFKGSLTACRRCFALVALCQLMCFQQVPTIKFRNPFVLITMQIAGGWGGIFYLGFILGGDGSDKQRGRTCGAPLRVRPPQGFGEEETAICAQRPSA